MGRNIQKNPHSKEQGLSWLGVSRSILLPPLVNGKHRSAREQRNPGAAFVHFGEPFLASA